MNPKAIDPTELDEKTPSDELEVDERGQVYQRVEPRFRMPGPAVLRTADTSHDAWLMNASRTGVLIAVAEDRPVNLNVSVELPILGGGDILLEGAVARTTTLSTPVEGFRFALGVKFDALSTEQNAALEALLRVPRPEALVTYELLTDILTRLQPADLASTILDPSIETPYSQFITRITLFERAAFQSQGPVELCVQRMILARTQALVVKAFLPELVANFSNIGTVVLNSIGSFLNDLTTLDALVDEQVRLAVVNGAESTRIGLNDVSSRLFNARNDLLRKIDQKLEAERERDRTGVLQKIHEQVSELHAVQSSSKEAVAAHAKFEVKKKANVISPKSAMKIWIVVGVAIVVGAALAYVIPNRRLSEYQLPLAVVTTSISDETLIVVTRSEDWEKLDSTARDLTFDGVEKYAKAKKLRQAKITDTEGNLLGALMHATDGQSRGFRRRIFR